MPGTEESEYPFNLGEGGGGRGGGGFHICHIPDHFGHLDLNEHFWDIFTFCQKPLSASSDLLELVDDQSVEGGEREDRQEPEGRNLVFMLGAGEL